MVSIMIQKNRRTLRVADLIKKELGWLIEKYLKDVNPGLITITNVKLSSDLRSAKIYYSVFSESGSRENAESALKKATPFLRNQLARNINLKYTPKIHFFYDDSLDYYNHIDHLIKKIHEDNNN